MKGQVAFEAITNLRDSLITEAAEILGFLDEPTPAFAKPARDREDSLLYRFFNSGWGVAMICAVVSLSVLGGIIWAGQRPHAGGPGGIIPPETTQALISEERAIEIASAYWGIKTGDVDPDSGYTFRVESMGQTQTPEGAVVYKIALRWLVDNSHYSTVELVWVDVMTGEVLIPFEAESETVDYIGEEQTDVWVKSGGETIYPQEFFVWSGPADGLGFYGTVQEGQAPTLPVAHFYLRPYDGTGEIFLPDGYEVKRITLYDGSMTDITDEKLNLLLLSEFDAFMSTLLPGRYYLSLYVEKQTADGEAVGCDYALEIRVQNSAQDIQPGHEANDYQRTWVALRDKIRSAGEPYKSVSSHSGLDLPIYETGIRKWYESRTGDYMVMIGVDLYGNIVMAFDHYQALVTLQLTTGGNMYIRVRSEGNYHCAETVTPPTKISHDFWFSEKNEWYSSVASHDAPLYYLLRGMGYMDEVMAELGEEFSFEALGYVYAK